jgi:endoglucanase
LKNSHQVSKDINMKKLFLLFLIPFLWVSCPSEDSPKEIKVTLNHDSLSLTVGETEKLEATVTNSDNKVVIWSSSAPAIARVLSTGTVTAVAEGTAIITAASQADETKTAQCTVTVTDYSQGEISVTQNKTSLSLAVSITERLTATVTNADDKAVTWSSSDKSKATVSTNGTVTAVAEGPVIITATSKADETKAAQCTVTVTPYPESELGPIDGLSGLSAAEYFEQKSIYIGWNLGNAFDADSGSGYGSWTAKINKDFLPKIKAAGFSMVRIPVTWDIPSHSIGAAPDYRLNQGMLNELTQVVDWAYDAGLVVIINIHHDDKTWLSLKNLRNAADYAEITAKFVKVWEQIAENFKDYGDWLIFEPINEMHADNNWGWYGGNTTQETADSKNINDLNQMFTDTIRAAGGRNTQRFLVVQPLCAKPHQAMSANFKLPTDTAAGKQIVSMHFYEPDGFCLSGSSINWTNKDDLAAKFQSYADKFTKNGIPIILGECGATFQNRSDPGQKATAHTNRRTYMEWMCGQAKANGIVPIYWDNGTIWGSSVGENFGLFDRRRSGGTLSVIPEMQEIIDVMINAVK